MHGRRSDDIPQLAQDMHELILVKGGLTSAFCDIDGPVKNEFHQSKE